MPWTTQWQHCKYQQQGNKGNVQRIAWGHWRYSFKIDNRVHKLVIHAHAITHM